MPVVKFGVVLTHIVQVCKTVFMNLGTYLHSLVLILGHYWKQCESPLSTWAKSVNWFSHKTFFLSICSYYFTLHTQGQHLGVTDFVTWTVRLSVVGCCITVSADKYYNGKGFCGHYLAYPIIKKYCCASCCYLFSARSLTHSLTHACI